MATLVTQLHSLRKSKMKSALKEWKADRLRGAKGDRGIQGVSGKDGKDGKNGADGSRGLQGIQGKQGQEGKTGKDGVSEVIHKEVAYDSQEILDELEELKEAYEKLNNNVRGGGVHGFGIPDPLIRDIIDERLDALVYIKLIDDETPIIYIGEADAGTAQSSPLWRIKRIDSTNDPDIDILLANGTSDFTNTWDNRASYTYS